MSTRDKILEAARLLFMKHGLEGVKMQMVADKAEVNKGLLHYYYKSKAKIFAEVFNMITNELLRDVSAVFSDDTLTLEDKISNIVDVYFSMLSKNRQLPVFFISEMNRDPDILKRLGFGEKIKLMLNNAKPALPKNKTPDFAIHFMITMISMSAFPFMVTPLLNELIDNEKQTELFLSSRKELVKNTLKNMIK